MSPRRPAGGRGRRPFEPARAPRPQPDGVAVSPLLGPLPAIYVSPSPGAGVGARLWRAVVGHLSGPRARVDHILRGTQ